MPTLQYRRRPGPIPPGAFAGGVHRLATVAAMTIRRPFALALVVLAVAMGVTACSSTETPAAPTDPVLAEGQQLYLANCASCHGRGGGGGLGPKLAGVVATRYPNIDDQKALILNGRGSMPAFKTRFTPEQLEAVTRYTRESL